MAKQPPATNKILEMDKEHFREIDGVVLDLDSYSRHSAAPSEETRTPEAPEAPSPVPAPVFAADPVHIGWYQPAEPEAVSYPIMAGAIPVETALQLPVACGSGSYLSSYASSFSTSFLTSWMTSYRYGSGSWITSFFYGSGSIASSAFPLGGFGLELI